MARLPSKLTGKDGSVSSASGRSSDSSASERTSSGKIPRLRKASIMTSRWP